MAENRNRSLFGLSGITGMLIATLLLLGILAYLTMGAIKVQSENSTKYYQIENPQDIDFSNPDNAKHYKLAK